MNFFRPLLLILLLAPMAARAQSVGVGTTAPAAQAALDIRAADKGLLIPRLTAAQRAAIAAPPQGLLVYQTDAPEGFYYFAGSPAPAWVFLNPSGGGADNLGNHTATQNLNLQAHALTGTGASVGAAVGLGVRADGGLNLGQNTTGNNVLLGYQAGALATGRQNLFVGYQAGQASTTGAFNQFSGYQSGYANTTGSNNVFSGYQSGLANTTGNSNVFSGWRSGFSNTTGNYNVFNGSGSGFNNGTGSSNVFSGYQSGLFNLTGSNNVFSGYQSGYNNSTGSGNTFTGYQSGYSNTTGDSNLFAGYHSGHDNTAGVENVFVGEMAGYSNVTGYFNTFIGNTSGYGNYIGHHNTYNGSFSGRNNRIGCYNTALGVEAGPPLGSVDLNNTTALGYNAEVYYSNSIRLGNAAITSLRCQVGLTVTSDARFKYDVQANVPGLAFVRRLRPVTYRFDAARQQALEHTGALRARSAPDPAARVQTGFLAQEVEAAARALGYAFDGVHAPANARDPYGLDYAQFVVPLVQAVQEQQQLIEQLKAQNAALQATQAADRAAAAELLSRVRALEATAAQASR